MRLPFKCVLALCPEKVNMGLELQFEDVLLVNAVRLLRGADCVAEQRETSQREVILQTHDNNMYCITACIHAGNNETE